MQVPDCEGLIWRMLNESGESNDKARYAYLALILSKYFSSDEINDYCHSFSSARYSNIIKIPKNSRKLFIIRFIIRFIIFFPGHCDFISSTPYDTLN